MSSLFFIGADGADPMSDKNELQGQSANIFFFHETLSLVIGRAALGIECLAGT
jgi:hypothetical protein